MSPILICLIAAIVIAGLIAFFVVRARRSTRVGRGDITNGRQPTL